MKRIVDLGTIAFVTLAWASSPSFAADKAPAKEKAPAAAKPAAKDEVTLKGTLGCGKCAFKVASGCVNVLKTSEGGKDVFYQLADNEVSQKNHGEVCGGTKPATVKGRVSEAGGKKTIAASEIKFD